MYTKRSVLLILVISLVLAFSLAMLSSCSSESDDNSGPSGPSGGDSTGHDDPMWYQLVSHTIHVETPSSISIMFQVLDGEGYGVDNLTTEDFEVLEDDNPVSPTESAMHIRKRDVIPYELKTVIAIDNSPSVASNLADIKAAATSLVQGIADQQQFAIIVFSEEVTILQDFTNDVTQLTSSIESIPQGYGTTDLYGAIMTGVQLWDDNYSTNSVEQGFLVALTDGSDQADRYSLSEALYARGNKRVYTIGLGDEIDNDALAQLGNAGFFNLDNVEDLAPQFAIIQEQMATYANSFYWLNYMSPKRGYEEHMLELWIPENKNHGSNATIEGYFNSSDFYGVPRGVFINPTDSNPLGIDSLTIVEGTTISLLAKSYMVESVPIYQWTADNEALLTITSLENDWSLVAIQGNEVGTTTITIEDTRNDLSKNIQFTFREIIEQDFALTDTTSITMVWIPAGTFMMGSDPSDNYASYDEFPEHEVTISEGFWIGKYEVTQEQWESVAEFENFYWDGYPNRPAENVSYNDIDNYFLPELGDQWRLPTEAEWEYACTAGNSDFIYWWGNSVSSYNEYVWCDNNCSQTNDVGLKSPNPWGLYDIIGNVAEWCSDGYDDDFYYYSPTVDPVGPPYSNKIRRGGSYWYGIEYCRMADRDYDNYRDRTAATGFRLVREAD